MKRTIQCSILLITIASITSGIVTAAPKGDRSKKELTVYGRVLKIDNQQRTFLISDRSAKKLYLVAMPDGAHFKIFFGIYRAKDEPVFANVYKGDILQIRCTRTSGDHLSRLDDGTEVLAVSATR